MRSSLATGLACCGLAGLMAACSSTGPVDLERLDAAQLRWSRRPFADYSYQARIVCFCPIEIVSRVRVEVRSDSIASVADVATGASVSTDLWGAWSTVDELFQRIRLAPESGGVIRVDATYDENLGFPRQIDFVPEEGLADAGWSQTIFRLDPVADP